MALDELVLGNLLWRTLVALCSFLCSFWIVIFCLLEKALTSCTSQWLCEEEETPSTSVFFFKNLLKNTRVQGKGKRHKKKGKVLIPALSFLAHSLTYISIRKQMLIFHLPSSHGVNCKSKSVTHNASHRLAWLPISLRNEAVIHDESVHNYSCFALSGDRMIAGIMWTIYCVNSS